jgi:hypothetical protein
MQLTQKKSLFFSWSLSFLSFCNQQNLTVVSNIFYYWILHFSIYFLYCNLCKLYCYCWSSPVSLLKETPPLRKYNTTGRGLLQSRRAEIMFWCCPRSCQSRHSRRVCVIVWGVSWQDGQVSESAWIILFAFVCSEGWWPQCSLARCTHSSLESRVFKLLMSGGGCPRILFLPASYIILCVIIVCQYFFVLVLYYDGVLCLVPLCGFHYCLCVGGWLHRKWHGCSVLFMTAARNCVPLMSRQALWEVFLFRHKSVHYRCFVCSLRWFRVLCFVMFGVSVCWC